MIQQIRTIDAHCGGTAVRLLTEGLPRPSGKTMAHKRDWLKRNADHIRRALLLEPRGSQDLLGAALTEPVTPGAVAGLLFLDAAGYPALSGTAVIAAVTIAVERRLIDADDVSHLTLDTPAGQVHADVRLNIAGDRRRVDTVIFTSLPSYVVTGGQVLRAGTRELRVDLAFGGALFAIVDSESTGVPLIGTALPELRRLAAQIVSAGSAITSASGPADHLRQGSGGQEAGHYDSRARSHIDAVVFTGPPQDPEAHLRSVVISGASIDRSASPTGTAAVMTVLDAMGLLDPEVPFVHESLTGTLLRGRVARRTQVGETPAIVPAIEGSAWITGEHTWLIDDDDPLREGFLL